MAKATAERRRDPRPRGRAGGAARGAGGGEAATSVGADAYPLGRALPDDGSIGPAVAGLPDPEILRLYRLMVLSRALDDRMFALQRQGRIGFYVGAAGEEASIVGAAAAMEDRDWIFPQYREHAAALLRGLPLATFVSGLLGNAGDLARGRQMPCHETWRAGRFASISSPLGTQLPHAVGAAWAARIRGDDVVALAYLGDGTTSGADFHAALNFAGVHRVPVVFACRNNGWAISTPREAQTASETIAQKAVAYGVHGERVDGNDLLAVHGAARRARARAAAGGGPTLLECVTYRVGPHTTSDDPRAYRADALVAPWRAKDPIPRTRRFLEGRGVLDAAADAALRRAVRDEVDAAVREAESLPPRPPVESLFEDVYAAPLRQQREQLDELRAAIAADPRVSAPAREGA
jgi:pyruvate dehydrogenase E1 component alpha subunit